jgi:hypothetical protein
MWPVTVAYNLFSELDKCVFLLGLYAVICFEMLFLLIFLGEVTS